MVLLFGDPVFVQYAKLSQYFLMCVCVCEREWLGEIKTLASIKKKNRASGKRNQINIGNCVFCARLKPLLSGRALSKLKSRKMAVIYYNKRKSYKCFFPPYVNSNGKKKGKLPNIFFFTLFSCYSLIGNPFRSVGTV